MKKLSELPIGSLIKDPNTKFDDQPITWIIADKNHKGYPNDTVTLISEKVLVDRQFDRSTTTYRDSELRGWINDNNGLMKDFSSGFKNAIVDTSISTSSGNTTDKMFLASNVEVGAEGDSAKEGYKFPIFTNDDSRVGKSFNNNNKMWWLRTVRTSIAVYCVLSNGLPHSAMHRDANGVRPLCNLKSETLVSESKDSDGAYTIIMISVEKTDLGKIDRFHIISFSVSGLEVGQQMTGGATLDGAIIQPYLFNGGGQGYVSIGDNDWLRLSNGKHTITIELMDDKGESVSETITFEKAVYELVFELAKPLEADAMVTKAMINLVGSIPKDAFLRVQACNNGHDASPTWEDVTTKVIKERKIFFANKQKTASKWGVNVRVIVGRYGAEGDCYISLVRGNFE